MFATATAIKPYTRSAGIDHSVWFADGSLCTFLATGEDTDGAFSLVEMIAPHGAEPPPHVHTAETECFYIVEGQVTFNLDGPADRREAGHLGCRPREHAAYLPGRER